MLGAQALGKSRNLIISTVPDIISKLRHPSTRALLRHQLLAAGVTAEESDGPLGRFRFGLKPHNAVALVQRLRAITVEACGPDREHLVDDIVASVLEKVPQLFKTEADAQQARALIEGALAGVQT